MGKFLIFPAWVKHSVSPFFGPGIRRALSFNLICPEASERTSTPMFEGSLKIDTAGGPDAKIQGDRDISKVGNKDVSDA